MQLMELKTERESVMFRKEKSGSILSNIGNGAISTTN